jgi:ankyrin repeat protein
MKTKLAVVIFTLLTTAGVKSDTQGVADEPQSARARQAVERALPLLQESARTWTSKTRCFSCHHQGLGATALALARERGFRVDEAKFTAEVAAIRAQLAPPEVSVSFPPNVDYLDDSLALVALAAAGVERDVATDREIYRLLSGQHVSGHWTPYPQRLPLEGSLFAQTAWTIRALRLFAPPGRETEVEARVARASAWLGRETPVETQDLAMQLLGFGWAGAASDRIQRTTKQLLALQRADGGWGQIAGRPSDAYATGQALVALNQAGRVSPTTASFKKGIAFLTSSQQADGSWLVETRRTWKRGIPYFESGFPHGKHQFISYAGSAWATMGLALAERNERSPVIMGDPRRVTSPRLLPPAVVSNQAAETSGGLTPLMQAALGGSRDELRALLEKRPDVNAVATPLCVTALMCAAHDPAKVAMLIAAGANVSATTLIAAGANVRATTTAGHTALLVATNYDGAAESVRLLLKHGADPNARLNRGRATPLLRAALRGDRTVADMLLAAGATLNDRPEGSTALMAAVSQSDIAFVTFLLDRGANLESQVNASAAVMNGENRPTPLMLAADRSATDLVRLLLKRGANVNARDVQGMTPLMYAAGALDCGAPTTAVVEILIAAKAEIGARTPTGETALDLAARYGKPNVVTLLRNAGAR